ncbi:hypothetical protein B0H14DRAFT_2600552 [Mycena olivaceomarginata]|nr:hypothetical protein B0H14DRAFT_2600552 [Mycena olivaceomarginata]
MPYLTFHRGPVRADGAACRLLIDVPLRRARRHHAHARTQHIRVPIERLITNGTGEWPEAAHEVERTGVAMVRTHAMELVARELGDGPGCVTAIHIGEGQTCELVRVNEDRGEAIDEQGSRPHMKIGPGGGENGCKEKRDAPDEGNAGAGTGMG